MKLNDDQIRMLECLEKEGSSCSFGCADFDELVSAKLVEEVTTDGVYQLTKDGERTLINLRKV